MDEDKFMNEVINNMTDEELIIFTKTMKQISDAEPLIEAEILRKEHGEL